MKPQRFGDYARFYNLLYKDKDYPGETEFILEAMRQNGCTPATLLDLGCGTGKHALAMTCQGIRVTGVDMSETMLQLGTSELEQAEPTLPRNPSPVLLLGDARSVRMGTTFDAVTSLFHVMSYQTEEQDALAVFATANTHLASGGLFFFDFWYGPGVLTDPPMVRERTLQDKTGTILRRAIPVHRVSDNVVDVHYEILFLDLLENPTRHIRECHSMRYWFFPELRHLAGVSGFKPVAEGRWMTMEEADASTWNAWMLCRKVV